MYDLWANGKTEEKARKKKRGGRKGDTVHKINIWLRTSLVNGLNCKNFCESV